MFTAPINNSSDTCRFTHLNAVKKFGMVPEKLLDCPLKSLETNKIGGGVSVPLASCNVFKKQIYIELM